VTIGDKNFTEQFVLGELYRQALRAQGFSVQLNRNIGPTDVTLQALKTGSVSMYPEYLNLFDSSIARDPHTVHRRPTAYAIAERYALAHGLELLTPTPFSDTDTIGVTVAYAQANHLNSLRDLGRLPTSVTVGGPPQFETTDPGLQTLERRYGFTVAGYKPLAVGDQYTALNTGAVQAADVGTTDGQLASGYYRALGDPQHVFGWGNAVPVVTAAVLSAEGPAFAETIDRVSALLTTPVMRQLNSAVDVAGQDPATVAKQFLETHGVIPPGP
jgi:osmoprotectant transport system substrate-binding protein